MPRTEIFDESGQSLADTTQRALRVTTIGGSGGGLTDAQLRASAVPVSGTVTANIGTVGTLALDATLTGGTQKAIVRGGAKGATAAADMTSTAEGVDHQAQDVQLYHGGAAVNPQTIRALTAADVITVTPPTLTKGTQGSTGFSTQPLRDAGRVLYSASATAIATVTTEALITLAASRDLTVAGGATTQAVTANKKLRLQSIIVTIRCTSTVNVGGIVRFRMLAGTVLLTSPIHASIGGMGSNLATAVIGNAQSYFIDMPEGFELSGTMQFGLTQLFSATSATIDVHVLGYEY